MCGVSVCWTFFKFIQIFLRFLRTFVGSAIDEGRKVRLLVHKVIQHLYTFSQF